jgi:hypothetical protein
MVLATACTSAPPAGEPIYSSVRDRLTKEPGRLFIGGEGSTGLISAERYTHDGWVAGTTPLTITNGELVGNVDRNGQLVVTGFGVGVDPIEIPESVFGKPAQLKDIRVTLTNRPVALTTWTDDDDASASVMLDLDLAWSIAVEGGVAPLGTQHLPPIRVDVNLSGGGDHIDGTIVLDAKGELWSWAGLMKLTELQLSLAARTVD